MKRLQLGLIIGVLILISCLCWSLSMMIPPLLVGATMAYMFRPLKAKFHFPGLPHEAGVVLAFSFILIFSTLAFFKVKSFLPGEQEKIELKIRLDYKLNQKFTEFFGETQNSILQMIGKEIKPAFSSLMSLLQLTPYEQNQLKKFPISDRYYAYYLENLKRAPLSSPPLDSKKEAKEPTVSSTHLLYNLSLWSLCPLVFIFLIFDNGQIRRFFISLIPNAYFEVTLTLLDRLDQALGLYLRGTAMECFLVGISTLIGLLFLGVPLSVAVLLSLFSGVMNAVPFLGPLIAGLAVLSSALIAESISPVFSWVTLETLPFAAFIVVGVVQFLDNLFFAPVVLGRAVNLHPLVVILSLSAASLLFGVWGVVITVPVVVVVNTITHTLFTQLKAYRLL